MSLTKKLFPAGAAGDPSFNIVTWTGDGSSRSVTGVGFQPDWVVIRSRTQSGSFTGSTFHYNSTSGARWRYRFNLSNKPQDEPSDYLDTFDSDGFTVYSVHNESSQDYVAWCWKFNGGTTSTNTNCLTDSTVQVNELYNMSLIQTDDSLGSPGTFGHGLSTTPTFNIYVEYPGGGNENTNAYTTAVDGGHDSFSFTGASFYDDGISLAAPTSTCLSGGAYKSFTAWSFADSDISKIGTYTGTGSSGISVTTGFATNFVMIRSTSSENVVVIDSVRGTESLYWSAINARGTSSSDWEIVFGSNGFTVNGTDAAINSNNVKFLYVAFSINV